MKTGLRQMTVAVVTVVLAGCSAGQATNTPGESETVVEDAGDRPSAPADPDEEAGVSDEAELGEVVESDATDEDAATDPAVPEWAAQAEALLADTEPCGSDGNLAFSINDELVEYADEHAIPVDIRRAVFRAELDFYDALCAGDEAEARAILNGLRVTLDGYP
jgi:hypothetical protein